MRKLVFKSSTHFYGCEQDDPAFFDETMGRPHAPRTPIERDILEAEASVAEFADKTPKVTVTILRFANVLGPDVRTSHIDMFSLPAVPMILGFDPRYQFVHEDDVVHALEHVVQRRLPGVFNVAGDGVLALSEVAGLLGKPYAPVLPPMGTGLAAALARRLGVSIPAEMLNQLRFGRGVDNRLLKAAGFEYGYTSREAVVELGEHLRLHPLLRSGAEPYRYEREVEEFLRWSPNVRTSPPAGHRGAGSPRAPPSNCADAEPPAVGIRAAGTGREEHPRQPCRHRLAQPTERRRGKRPRSGPSNRNFARTIAAVFSSCPNRRAGPYTRVSGRFRTGRCIMRTKAFISVAVALALLLAGAAAVYAYDSSREDTIAKGVMIGGIDVGGLASGRGSARRCAPSWPSR